MPRLCQAAETDSRQRPQAMKPAYEAIEIEEPLANKDQHLEEVKPVASLWTTKQLLLGIAFCLVLGTGASALAYTRLMHSPGNTSAHPYGESLGAKKLGAGLLFW